MNVFLTAAGEAPVITKFWNLVDWFITNFELSVGGSIAANIVGAILCIAIPYLMGSISPAILICRHLAGIDIRTVGKKKASTYNVLLSCGSKPAAINAVCEFCIGFAAIWVGRLIWEANGAGLALFMVVFGNLFPVFHRMSGGKGIVTMIGASAALNPIITILLVGIFLLAVISSKLVAFGSVAITLLFALFVRSFANSGLQLAMAVFVTGVLLIVHWPDFRRVQEGEEEKFYISQYIHLKRKKKSEDEDDE